MERLFEWTRHSFQFPGSFSQLRYYFKDVGPQSFSAIDSLQRQWDGFYQKSLDPVSAAIVEGVLLGQRAQMRQSLVDNFVATGTVHILATAGLHVGILMALLLGLFRLITVPRQWACMTTIFLLTGYCMLAGGRASVVRATITAGFYLVGVVLRRNPDIPTTLSAAALCILLQQPAALYDADFQMSFATVYGLSLSMPLWDEWGQALLIKVKGPAKKLLRFAMDLIGLCIFAQLFSAPLVAFYTNQVSFLGLPANLAVVPLVILLLPIVLASGLLSWVSASAGACALKWLAAPIVHSILWVVSSVADIPGCAVSVGVVSWEFVVLLYGALFGSSFVLRRWVGEKAAS